MKNIYVNNGLHRELKVISAEDDKTIQILVEEIIKEFLKNRKVKK